MKSPKYSMEYCYRSPWISNKFNIDSSRNWILNKLSDHIRIPISYLNALLSGLPVTSPPGKIATSELATKERSHHQRTRHQAKSSRCQPPIKRRRRVGCSNEHNSNRPIRLCACLYLNYDLQRRVRCVPFLTHWHRNVSCLSFARKRGEIAKLDARNKNLLERKWNFMGRNKWWNETR